MRGVSLNQNHLDEQSCHCQEEYCLASNHNEWLVAQNDCEDNLMHKQHQLQYLAFEEGSGPLIDLPYLSLDEARYLDSHLSWIQRLEL